MPFANLLENAIAHTPVGTTAEIDLDASGVIRVSDCGPGVAPHERELVFRRFWRRDRRRTGSAGLGLSIVSRIVEAHGGSISVSDGPGAVFSLSLASALVAPPVDGDVPSPPNGPSGCRFHARCPFAFSRCHSEAPTLHEVIPGRVVACHLALSLSSEDAAAN